jgi:hypothetical protein
MILVKKGYVIGVTILFLGIVFLPCIPADEDRGSYDISIEYSEKGSYEGYEEIISFISGSGHITMINHKGLLLREVVISTCGIHGGPNLLGVRKSPYGGNEIFFERGLNYVHVPRFRGIIVEPQMIVGFAYGDIGWG